MKKIENGFADYYYLDEEGKVYNSKAQKYINKYKHSYKLKTKEGELKSIAIKRLYKMVYNKQFCIDNIKDLQNEVWKEIRDTNGYYYVSSCGRVKSYHGYEAIILETNKNKGGYDRVDIIVDGIRQTKLVSHLVAYAFLPMPQKPFMELHHKDLNRNNNNANNLQWLSKLDHIKLHKEIKYKNERER